MTIQVATRGCATYLAGWCAAIVRGQRGAAPTSPCVGAVAHVRLSGLRRSTRLSVLGLPLGLVGGDDSRDLRLLFRRQNAVDLLVYGMHLIDARRGIFLRLLQQRRIRGIRRRSRQQ